MAELLIKIGTNGPNPLWQDGDVVHCFNNRRIRWEWATNVICHLDRFGFNGDGLRPYSLAWKWYQHTHQFRFQRVSRNEVDRYDTINGVTERFSEKPNDKGRYIHLETYLKRRVAHHNHKIFGSPGSEEWYGGRKDFSNEVMDRVWCDIEKDSSFRECNFLHFPLSDREKQIVLAVTIPNVCDAQAELFQSEEIQEIIDPVKSLPVDKCFRRRQHKVAYRELSFIELDKVLDLQMSTDYREKVLPLDAILHKARMLVHG